MGKVSKYIKNLFTLKNINKTKDVALVLSGGGARGYFHIGAIEALREKGYNITSVAGTSMGALVGGAFANGKLDELKYISLQITRKKFLKLMNFSMGLDHISNGDKIMDLFENTFGKTVIEDLPIPFSCCASNIITGEEHVFTSGSLSLAVRASISIPGLFKPLKIGNSLYVDGSIHNTLPLNRVKRTHRDLLIASNVNGKDNLPYNAYTEKKENSKGRLNNILQKLPFHGINLSANYINMAIRVANLSTQVNTQLALQLTPPDLLIELPMDSYSLFDFDKASKLIKKGREAMINILNNYEKL